MSTNALFERVSNEEAVTSAYTDNQCTYHQRRSQVLSTVAKWRRVRAEENAHTIAIAKAVRTLVLWPKLNNWTQHLS